MGGTPSFGPPPRASPSVWGRLRACTDLIGRRVRPGGLFRPPMGCLQNFWGGTLGGVSMYHDIFKRMQQAARFLFSFRRGRGPTDGGAYFSLRITVPLRSYSRVFVCEIRKFEVCYIDFSRPSPESKSGRGIHQKNRFGSGSMSPFREIAVLTRSFDRRSKAGIDLAASAITLGRQSHVRRCPADDQRRYG